MLDARARTDAPGAFVTLYDGALYVTGHFVATHPDRVRTLTLADPAAASGTLPAVITMPVVGAWFWPVFQAPNAARGQPSDFLHPEGWPDWIAEYEP